MANIRYAGDEPSTEAFGKTFIAGEWTDDADLDAQAVAILAQNPQFMVTDGNARKVKAAPETVVDVAPQPEPNAPIQPDPPTVVEVEFDPNAPAPAPASDEPNPAA